MTNRPVTPTQNILAALRDLAFERGLGSWFAVMLMFSIPIAFGIEVSGLVSSFVDIFIQPILLMFLGNLQSWVLPLGGTMYFKGTEIDRGIYIGTFLLSILRFIAAIGILFLMVKGLKSLASRTN
jgi:large-conductance mechanosensitive channel